MIHPGALPRRQHATLLHHRKKMLSCVGGRVGHPPLGPFPLPKASMELQVCRSKETFLPADIYGVFKDNTLSLEAAFDGCPARLRLMDTHIYRNGAVDCAWPPAKSSRPVFKPVSALPLSCTYVKPWQVNVR